MHVTPFPVIDGCLRTLNDSARDLQKLTLDQRIFLAESCIQSVERTAEEWVDIACRLKGIAPDDPVAAEEILGGPLAVVRYLRIVMHSLKSLRDEGRVRLPGSVAVGPHGRRRIPVFPTLSGLYDGLLFRGFRGEVWTGTAADTTPGTEPRVPAATVDPGRPEVCLVLGAGNVTGIAPVDALGKLFEHHQAVLLKLNPVLETLGPVWEKAFAALIEKGMLRLVYGGADTGNYAVHHELVACVHITGSAHAHEVIVWGGSGIDAEKRRVEQKPLMSKPISSELGNVTPWIVVPGRFTDRQLAFQAENVAAMIVNNASFNCVAAKIIVTYRGWDQREQFLDRIEAALARVPRRTAYYPNAARRYRRFAHRDPDREDKLPWTLIRGTDPQHHPELFHEESFVCVSGETAVEAASPDEYIAGVADVVNDNCWGTLAAGVMVPDAVRQSSEGSAAIQRLIEHLDYGTVALNHWPGLAFGMMCTPWGGSPGSSVEQPRSGRGWVHNPFFVPHVQKSVITGPLVVWPKPVWLPSHRAAHRLAWQLFRFYCRPAWWKLPAMVPAAFGA